MTTAADQATAANERISAEQLVESLGKNVSQQITDALAATVKPSPEAEPKDPDAKMEQPSALQTAITNAMSELDKATTGSSVLMSKDGADHIFKMLTSTQAQAHLEDTAEMGQILSPIERAINPLVPNLPLGSLAVGAFSGLLAGEFIDGFTPPTPGQINFTNIAVKGIAAIGFVTAGSQIMSKQAAMAGAAILTAQILADVLPLDEWIARIRGVFNGGQQTAAEAQRWLSNQPHRQADPVGSPQSDLISDIF